MYGEKNVDGNWILTREDSTPDSERHTERDDLLFASLQVFFQGTQTQLDFEALATQHQIKPEDVFIDLHENYGYICIGTGENPAANEKLTPAQALQRQTSIKQALENEHLPHIAINGKYMGVEENSYFIPFNDKPLSMAKVMQGEIVRKVEKIAHAHQQDSLLICHRGYAAYLYTTGKQKGHVITGKTAVVYPGKEQLPDDCYSLFVNQHEEGGVGFTCGLDFNRIYSCIDEYAAQENSKLQLHYKDYVTQCDNITVTNLARKKLVVLLRGTDGYNLYGINLKNELEGRGLKAVIFGSDANIAKINEEVDADNKNNGPKAGWAWPQVRNEFLERNKKLYEFLLAKADVDVVIYADMNKVASFMEPYVKTAAKYDCEVISHVVNSFVFEPGRSEYIEKLCQRFGAFMGRHLMDFKSAAGQITADRVKTTEMDIAQLHGVPANELTQMLATKLKKNIVAGHYATTFAASMQNDKSEEVKAEDKLRFTGM